MRDERRAGLLNLGYGDCGLAGFDTRDAMVDCRNQSSVVKQTVLKSLEAVRVSEMIERVKKALIEVELDRYPGEAIDSERMARAAIEAMREPTTSMVVAGLECSHIDLASEWRAMIDAVLKQEETANE